MSAHAKLSPSAAERWMTCPGSIVLSEGMPEKSSEFAEEGTCAHALGEACLLDELPTAAFVGLPFEYDDHGTKKSVVMTQEMADAVQVYVDDVNATMDANEGAVLHIEQRVHVNEQVHGTADTTIWAPVHAELFVKDYKHGAGVAVEVDGNLQLKIYALAALLEFKYPARTVTATIVQPRCPHSDGPVRSVTYDVVDLLDFHADLLDAVERVKQAGFVDATQVSSKFLAYLKPSEKGCRWCLAAPKCPALKNKAQTLAKQVFAPSLPYDPKALAETLDFLPILEGWIKNTREFAYSEAERGHDVPNWKLVEKRATRKWKLEPSVVAARLCEGSATLTTADLYSEPELKSPAVIEEAAGERRTCLAG